MKWIVAGVFALMTSAYALNIYETLDDVLRHHPILQERLSNYNQTMQDIRTVEAQNLPALNFTAGLGREVTDGRSTGYQEVALDVQKASLTLNQSVFNGFKTTYELKQNKDRLYAAAFSYLDKADDLVIDVIDSCLNLFRHYRILQVEKENYMMHEEIFLNMKKKYDSGLGKISDLKEVKSKVALAYSNYLAEDNNYQEQYVKFHKLYGRYVKIDELEEPKFIVENPNDLNYIISRALTTNPAILVTNYEVDAGINAYKASNNSFYPKVDIELRRDVGYNQSGLQGRTNGYSAMLNLSYNLYNGGADDAKRETLISTFHQRDTERQQKKMDLISEIQLSWNSKRLLQKQIEYLDIYKISSEEKLKSYYEEFDLGRRSLLDLLSAGDDFNSARKQMINAEYDLLMAKFRIQYNMGDLLETLNLRIRHNVGVIDHQEVHEVDARDTQVIDNDFDYDGAPNAYDICNNSQLGVEFKTFGCEESPQKGFLKFEPIEEFYSDSNKSLDLQNSSIEGWDDETLSLDESPTPTTKPQTPVKSEEIQSATYSLSGYAYLRDKIGGGIEYVWPRGEIVEALPSQDPAWMHLIKRMDSDGNTLGTFDLWIEKRFLQPYTFAPKEPQTELADFGQEELLPHEESGLQVPFAQEDIPSESLVDETLLLEKNDSAPSEENAVLPLMIVNKAQVGEKKRYRVIHEVVLKRSPYGENSYRLKEGEIVEGSLQSNGWIHLDKFISNRSDTNQTIDQWIEEENVQEL